MIAMSPDALASLGAAMMAAAVLIVAHLLRRR